MKKIVGVVFGVIIVVTLTILGIWKSLRIENIVDDLYLVNNQSVYYINPRQLKLVKLYQNTGSDLVWNKVLKVPNIPAIYFQQIVPGKEKESLPGEQNVITAWVSKTDSTQITLAETNTRLKLTKTYHVSLNLGPDLELLDPVYDLRLARGGDIDNISDLGCIYGDNSGCIWIIPKVEPLKGPNDYKIQDIPTRYIDTIAFPVVERFYDKVEYKHMYETLWTDQPSLDSVF